MRSCVYVYTNVHVVKEAPGGGVVIDGNESEKPKKGKDEKDTKGEFSTKHTSKVTM